MSKEFSWEKRLTTAIKHRESKVLTAMKTAGCALGIFTVWWASVAILCIALIISH